MPSKKKFFVRVCIKCVKTAKKYIKNVTLKLLAREDPFRLIDLKIESVYKNWAQILDKCDPKKQKQHIRINA